MLHVRQGRSEVSNFTHIDFANALRVPQRDRGPVPPGEKDRTRTRRRARIRAVVIRRLENKVTCVRPVNAGSERGVVAKGCHIPWNEP